MAKKRKAKAKARKKTISKKQKKRKKTAKPTKKEKMTEMVENLLEQEARELFAPPKKPGFSLWMKRYSPVIITLGIGLIVYFFLVFYLFYPTAIIQGHYIQLLLLLIFVFLIAGILIYFGMRSELLFVRVLSFIFVFVIFTFLLLFVLIAHTMQAGRYAG